MKMRYVSINNEDEIILHSNSYHSASQLQLIYFLYGSSVLQVSLWIFYWAIFLHMPKYLFVAGYIRIEQEVRNSPATSDNFPTNLIWQNYRTAQGKMHMPVEQTVLMSAFPMNSSSLSTRSELSGIRLQACRVFRTVCNYLNESWAGLLMQASFKARDCSFLFCSLPLTRLGRYFFSSLSKYCMMMGWGLIIQTSAKQYCNKLNIIKYHMQLQVKPRYYSEVNKQMDESYYNYEAYQIQYGNIQDYEIITKIGKGKYSEVYTGIGIKDDNKVVIKVLKPVKKSKMKREIKILKALTGHPGIIELKDVVRDPASKTTCIIFDHLDNTDFRSLIPNMNDMETRFYLFELLKALDFCHSKGIMHRDVKPQNIIVNPAKKVLKLIDWGLAQFYHMGQDYNVRVASRYFKGPELLVDYNYYDYSLDIWSVGAMFASMIFKKQPFFMGDSNRDQLVKICQVLGTEGLYKYLKKYQLKLDDQYYKILGKVPVRPWSKFIKPQNQALCHQDALDLLSRMLVYDHAERILPKQAIMHKYFDPVRK